MTLEQQLTAILIKHDLVSVTVQAIEMSGGSGLLISSEVQCMTRDGRKCFSTSERGGDASALLAQSIAKAAAVRAMPTEVEQLAGIKA